VEEKDADETIRQIREINSGTYVFDRGFLEAGLPRLTDVNAQREFYLTDLVLEALATGERVVPLVSGDPDEVKGINSRRELAEASRVLRLRKLEELLDAGVTIVDPDHACVDPESRIGPDSVIEPSVMITGKSRIGRGVLVQTGCVVRDSVLEDGVILKPYSVIESSRVKKGAIIGPFAYLQPKADIGKGARIGSFVEVDKSRIGKESQVGPLSYLGNAAIGAKVCMEAGAVTCDRDYNIGCAQKIMVRDGVFVGSDTTLISPVTVEKGSRIGAGSTITGHVPPYALAISRAEQKVSENWVVRKEPERLKKNKIPVTPLVKKRGDR